MQAVEDVDGMSFHRMYFDIYQALDVDSLYDYAGTLTALDVLPSFLKVYVGSTEVATDDGANVISDPGGGVYTVSGVIDYTTGVIGVDISPSPATTVSVRYQQDNDGDIGVNKNQICKAYDVVITSSYVS